MEGVSAFQRVLIAWFSFNHMMVYIISLHTLPLLAHHTISWHKQTILDGKCAPKI